MKRLAIILLILFGAAGAAIYRYLTPPESPVLPLPAETRSPEEQAAVPYTIVEVARELSVPWSIVFTGSERMLISERSGRIREIVGNKLTPEPLYTFREVSTTAEEGLMGLAVDPDYQINKYLYAAVAYPNGNTLAVKIVRLIDNTTTLTADRTIIDNIPAARYHAGTRIAFGPDNKFYITTGDATDKQIAQDPNSLGGKILRMNADGTIPTDNPIPNSYVYALGLRNSQGIDWDNTGRLFSVDHGPSTFDGPPGGDEVNYITPGGNYGWPLVSHDRTQPDLISPILVFTPAVAPASTMVYSGKLFPQFTNNIFFGGLRGTGLYRVVVDQTNPAKAVSYEKLADIQVGRIREVTEGPDGAIYISTSNRDGRGQPQSGDDKIYKLIPQ